MLDFIPTTHLQNIKHIEWWSLKAPILDFEGLTVGSFLHKKRILLFAKSALKYSLQNRNANTNKTGYLQCCSLLSAQQVKEFFKLVGHLWALLLIRNGICWSVTDCNQKWANFLFNLSSHYQIYIAVYLFIKRDD